MKKVAEPGISKSPLDRLSRHQAKQMDEKKDRAAQASKKYRDSMSLQKKRAVNKKRRERYNRKKQTAVEPQQKEVKDSDLRSFKKVLNNAAS